MMISPTITKDELPEIYGRISDNKVPVLNGIQNKALKTGVKSVRSVI